MRLFSSVEKVFAYWITLVIWHRVLMDERWQAGLLLTLKQRCGAGGRVSKAVRFHFQYRMRCRFFANGRNTPRFDSSQSARSAGRSSTVKASGCNHAETSPRARTGDGSWYGKGRNVDRQLR